METKPAQPVAQPSVSAPAAAAPVPASASVQPAPPAAPATPPPSIEPIKKPVSMFVKIIRIVIPLTILTALLFTPVPYYQKDDTACKPGQTDCPKKGWHVSNSVFMTILGMATGSGKTANTPVSTPSATIASAESTASAATANWKTYTNTAYGYSLQYPPTFSTQMLAAGAVVKEATATAGNIYLFRSEVLEPYVERYINVEAFQVKPPYTQGVITKTTLDKLNADKIVIPNAKFDIYSVSAGKAFLEIYVSNNPDKKELANQILSTLKITAPPIPAAAPAASASAIPGAQISDMDKVRATATDYLVLKGNDRTKLKILAVTPLGNLMDKFKVSYIPSVDHTGNGLFILVGMVNGQWVIPDYRSTIYCGWVNASGSDENTVAFLGCGK